MNKRRERLSPVIEAERRRSGVLERRASSLDAECVQLGADLVKARQEAEAARRDAHEANERAAFHRKSSTALRKVNADLAADLELWKSECQKWHAVANQPPSPGLFERIAARFGRSS
jgi:chromosome segregation ATPase